MFTVFISEITARAFIIADSNKRRTLSRADIAKALSKSDQFDFLIDIVPREELPFSAGSVGSSGGAASGSGKKAVANVKHEQVRWDLANSDHITHLGMQPVSLGMETRDAQGRSELDQQVC